MYTYALKVYIIMYSMKDYDEHEKVFCACVARQLCKQWAFWAVDFNP